MNKNSENIIGIVGGVGPYAGLDLMKKILEQTAVSPIECYICAALDDFYNTIYRCSEAPVKVIP